jgi:4-hydroxy-L-threonine phosphate dehydrogenase PdxA
MLAELTGTRVAMMLTSTAPTTGGSPLRVVLATTHLPLREVPDAVTTAAIVDTAEITRDHLIRWFDLAEPRPEAARIRLRRADDDLCLHAGDGPGQRPYRRLRLPGDS